jgi:hypothetical protein
MATMPHPPPPSKPWSELPTIWAREPKGTFTAQKEAKVPFTPEKEAKVPFSPL